MSYNYETQSYLAYVRAVEFENAVDVMELSSVHLLIPEIVNAAFSCELILKATIIMEKESKWISKVTDLMCSFRCYIKELRKRSG